MLTNYVCIRESRLGKPPNKTVAQQQQQQQQQQKQKEGN
jgi:hypothetical protein